MHCRIAYSAGCSGAMDCSEGSCSAFFCLCINDDDKIFIDASVMHQAYEPVLLTARDFMIQPLPAFPENITAPFSSRT